MQTVQSKLNPDLLKIIDMLKSVILLRKQLESEEVFHLKLLDIMFFFLKEKINQHPDSSHLEETKKINKNIVFLEEMHSEENLLLTSSKLYSFLSGKNAKEESYEDFIKEYLPFYFEDFEDAFTNCKKSTLAFHYAISKSRFLNERICHG